MTNIFCIEGDRPLPPSMSSAYARIVFGKLERDLIRARDQDYSVAAFMLSDDQREALRERVIRAYGLGHELLVDVKKPRRKNKRSHSRATQHKREIAAQAIRNYNIHDVLQSGRFPTLSELRYAILEFGYQLEETHDWYVTSKDDYTEIWFSEGSREQHQPTSFWFRPGDLSVLNIMQRLANQCGSFLVADYSGARHNLIVPDSMFGSASEAQVPLDYVTVMTSRIPFIIEHLGSVKI